ncbi:hypothetical protein EGY31_15355 [Burkholderia multivorans]|nr:hypothetical protein EGY31_15355 [Burkholderia multivorans]
MPEGGTGQFRSVHRIFSLPAPPSQRRISSDSRIRPTCSAWAAMGPCMLRGSMAPADGTGRLRSVRRAYSLPARSSQRRTSSGSRIRPTCLAWAAMGRCTLPGSTTPADGTGRLRSVRRAFSLPAPPSQRRTSSGFRIRPTCLAWAAMGPCTLPGSTAPADGMARLRSVRRAYSLPARPLQHRTSSGFRIRRTCLPLMATGSCMLPG